MIDHEKSRCYLLARFKLQNGDQRYLLEIDTSDNRKTMSTRIMGFKAGVEAGKCIDRILRGDSERLVALARHHGEVL